MKSALASGAVVTSRDIAEGGVTRKVDACLASGGKAVIPSAAAIESACQCAYSLFGIARRDPEATARWTPVASPPVAVRVPITYPRANASAP